MSTPPAEWALPKLRVDVDGDWFDGDEPVTHPGVLANLRDNLRCDADGYFVQMRFRLPVQVDDVPFVVVRIEPAGADALRAVLNDGTETGVDPTSVRIGRGDVPYCSVKNGAFEARLSRAATFQLLRLAEYDEQTGRGVLRLGGREYPLTKIDWPQGPDAARSADRDRPHDKGSAGSR